MYVGKCQFTYINYNFSVILIRVMKENGNVVLKC